MFIKSLFLFICSFGIKGASHKELFVYMLDSVELTHIFILHLVLRAYGNEFDVLKKFVIG